MFDCSDHNGAEARKDLLLSSAVCLATLTKVTCHDKRVRVMSTVEAKKTPTLPEVHTRCTLC